MPSFTDLYNTYPPIYRTRSHIIKNITTTPKKKRGTMSTEFTIDTLENTNNESPNIILTNNEKDRNVISFEPSPNNAIDGIEVIRSDESPTSFDNIFSPTKPEPRETIPEPNESKPEPKVTKIDTKPTTYKNTTPKSKDEFAFDDFSSFVNPIKQKPPSEIKKKITPSIGGYSSDEESYQSKKDGAASYKSYVSSIESPKSYQSFQSDTKSLDPDQKYKNEIQEKQDLLIKLQQLETKGVRLSKSFSMKSNIDELRFEYEKQKSILEQQESVKFMQNALITFVHGVEILNRKFDPVGAKLNGWSNSVMEDIGSYEGVFQRLHEKYRGTVEMAPELELLLTLVQSAFMFHLMETIFKGAIPNLGQAISSDPNLVNGLMRATAKAADQSRQQVPQPSNAQPMGGPSFNIGDILGPLMGGVMGNNIPRGPMPPTYVPPGNNAFRDAIGNPPPPPVMTRDTEYDRKQTRYDDSDRFSLASTNSNGSEIRSPNITISENPKGKGKKTIYM